MPEVDRLINSTFLIDLVCNYLGCIPTLSTVSSWWSFPGRQTAGAQFYHQDRGDFSSLNLFVYLTDVDVESGPHIYCPSTHTFEKLQYFVDTNLDLMSAQMFWDWWELHRKSDDTVNHFFKPITITGPTGTSFLEDTRGLHKGLAPLSKQRLCFELVWTLIPQFNSKLISPIPSSCSHSSETCKQINRLAYTYSS